MKLNKFFMGILGALALTACSSDDVIPEQPTGPIEDVEAKFMSVTIRNANPTTRDDDKQFEDGLTTENTVNTLRFYFFNDKGEAAPVKFNGENFYDCTKGDDNAGIVQGPGTSDNIEQIVKAVIVINSKEYEANQDIIKQMVAIVNYESILDKLGNTNLSLSELQEIIGDAAQTNVEGNPLNGFLMSSSNFITGDGESEAQGLAVQIQPGDIKPSKEIAEQYPVDLYVERVVAKVRVSMKWNDLMSTREVTYNNKKYQAIALTSQPTTPGTAGSPILTSNTGGQQVYVIFDKWDLWWTADKSYLFKKMPSKKADWADLGAWNWNDPNFYRSYWAENPSELTLAKHAHNFASYKFMDSGSDKAAQFENTSTDAKEFSAYCLENAADFGNNGLKKSYLPQSEVSNRTLVYLSAILVTVNEDNVAEPLTLVEWAGYKYTEEGALAAMFAPNQNIVYFRTAEPTGSKEVSSVQPDGSIKTEYEETYTWLPLEVKDVEFVSGLASGNATDDKEDSPRYHSFLNLVSTDKLFADRTFEETSYKVQPDVLYRYDSQLDDYVAYTSLDEVNNLLESVGGAKVWRDGNTYYYHDLRHLNTVTGAETKGMYGVVRNHIYDVQLNTVYGLGTPVLSPKAGTSTNEWEEIIPQKPNPDSYFLGARVNILSWRIVNNNVSLDW